METDLLTLAKEDGFIVAVSSNSRGGQYNGPCPWCKGKDRFRVQPNYGKFGWFICSQCGRKGSAINYLMMKRKMTVEAARILVGWTPEDDERDTDTIPKFACEDRPSWEAPPQQWQETAQAFVQYCQETLWSAQGQAALSYLHQRGLTDSTIKEARLGYYPRQATGSAKAWGRPVKLHQGIVIPWFIDGDVWRLTIRDEQIHKGQGRYKQVAGGSNGLYLSDTLKQYKPLAVVTEGEFDALSILQECGDFAAVVATGTTQGSHIPRWVSLLAQQDHVLVAFDADDGEPKGDKAAQWWLDRLKNAQRLRPVWEDANQMLQDGADLRQWVASGLISMARNGEASPICCVCGKEVEVYSEQGIAYCGKHWQNHSQASLEPDPPSPLPDRAPGQNLAHEQQVTIVCSTQATFVQDVAAVAQCLSTDCNYITLDLETTGLNAQTDKIVSIALGVPGRATILDVRPYYTLPKEIQAQWKQELTALLHTPTVTWIGHNLKFDWKFLLAQFGIRLPQIYDTMLAEQLIHGVGLSEREFSVGLQQTAARYQIAVEKEQRVWFPGLDTRPEWSQPFPQQQLAYMVQDVDVPHRIYQLQQQRIRNLDLARIVQIENQALPALAAMELRGVLIDQALWRSMLQKKSKRRRHLEQEIATTLGEALQKAYDGYQQALHEEEQRLMHAYQSQQTQCTWPTFRKGGLATWKANHQAPAKPTRTAQGAPSLNLASSTQLLSALHVLGIPAPSTRESSLEPYAAHSPLVATLLQWKKLQKFCSSFGENILAVIGPDGRLRGDFAQIGAVSGRIICSKPNLQQIPSHEKNEDENIRRCFIAPAGYKLLKADLSNIELRILAEVAQDRELLRLFAEGADLHAETAKLMFNLPPETDTRVYLYKGKASARDIAKTINYGLAYGMGAQGLAARVGVSEGVAKELMTTYFNTYAGVARWLRTTAKQALKQGYAVTLAGRRRPFITTSLDDQAARGAMERSAKNHPIQGLNADIIKRALALLYQRLPETAHIVLAVHDEVVLECPEQSIKEVEGILKGTMVQACRDFLTVVHIPEPDVFVESYWKKD